MEIMEDGNLVDRVRILLQRDLQYYQEKQTVLREPLCVRVSGGKLDFPRHASFAATKIVSWWETEFRAAFKRDSGLSRGNRAEDDKQNDGNVVVKDTSPSEFVLLVADTSDQFLEHLHTLIQESLDHADLTVLTATLGAAALVRNALWCYSQRARGSLPTKDSSEKLSKCYKAYHEMAEAVAERLLDLHCRLISLYILNEADSLDWQAEKPFFECERSSFVIQMWWLYMEGTRADLWDTVPPKMAQRVFSGMLNESLSIITTRFIHGKPSLARSEQFWTDAFNVLCCTGYLSVAACSDSHEVSGLRLNRLPTAARDLHSKCHELLVALLLRGAPLAHLFQNLRNGLEKSPMLRKRHGPAPWLLISAPKLLGYPKYRRNDDSDHLQEDQAVVLELNVLRAQPQPNWTQLVKVLSMNGYAVSRLLLAVLVRRDAKTARDGHKEDPDCCDGFLCARTSCSRALRISPSMGLFSLVRVLSINAEDPDFRAVFVSALKEDPDWARHLDKQQVWNQSIPAWLEALLIPFEDMMLPIADNLLEAVKTGASTYQAMSLVLACFAELHSCAPSGILRLAVTFDENLPADCRPIGGSALLQFMCAALYSRLLMISQDCTSFSSSSSSAIALAEAVCSIDEDNKHTDQIEHFLRLVKLRLEPLGGAVGGPEGTETLPAIIEVKADKLLFTESGRKSFKVSHECLVRASDWILERLKGGLGDDVDDKGFCVLYASPPRQLTRVMFHVGDEVFDQFLDDENKDWKSILSTPLSISVDRLRRQLLLRAELKSIPSLVTLEEREIAVFIKQLCSSNSSSSR